MKQALAGLVLLAAVASARADDTIWGGLVLATNENPAKPVPKKLEAFAPTVTSVFGYNTLYLLGDARQAIGAGTESWLIPSREFFFRVTTLSKEPSRYTVRVELFRKESALLTTEAKLALGAPLFIRGPQWGKGQLVLILEVR